MLAEIGPQVTGSYHIPVTISDMCHFLSYLQRLDHRLQAATTYLLLFQTCVIFCHACRGWATGYRQLPHTWYYFRQVLFFVMLAGVEPQVTGGYHIPVTISDIVIFCHACRGSEDVQPEWKNLI